LHQQYKTILKNTGYLVGARGVNIIVRGLYAIALARFLGAEDYGLYSYALAWYLAFMPFTSLGLWAVVSRDYGQSESFGKRTIAQSLALRGVLSLITAAGCGLLGWWIHDDVATRELLIVFSVTVLGRALAVWVEHALNATGNSSLVFKLESFFRPLEAIGGLLILFSGGEILEVALMHGVVWSIQGLVAMYLMQRAVFSVTPEWNKRGITRLLRKGALLGVSSFLLVWFLQGPLLLARQASISLFELGQLALLLQVFTILSAIPQMFTTAALPLLSTPEMQASKQDRSVVLVSLKLSWIVGMLIGILGWGFGEWIVYVIFGSDFILAGKNLGLVLFLLIPWAWGQVLMMRMVSHGLIRLPTLALVLGSAAFVFAFFLPHRQYKE